MKDCEARAVFAAAVVRAGIVPDGGAVRFVVGGADRRASTATRTAIGAQPTTPIDDECEGNWMFYSSGTTGRPKGIKPPGVGGPLGEPGAFTALVQGLYGGSESTRYLSPAPLYHAAPSGWASAVHRLGGTVVTTERFDPVEFLEAIERHRVTLAQVVPTHMVRLLKLPEADRTRFDLSSLEILVHAAAPCPPDVKRAVIEWLGPIVYEYYSGSEGVGFCAIGPDEWLAHPGSVGTLAARRGPHRRPRRQRGAARNRGPGAGSRSRPASSTTATRRRRRRPSTSGAGARSATWGGSTRRATSTSPTASRT